MKTCDEESAYLNSLIFQLQSALVGPSNPVNSPTPPCPSLGALHGARLHPKSRPAVRSVQIYRKVYYCISAAIHSRVVRVRSVENRRIREAPRRFPARQQKKEEGAKN